MCRLKGWLGRGAAENKKKKGRQEAELAASAYGWAGAGGGQKKCASVELKFGLLWGKFCNKG